MRFSASDTDHILEQTQQVYLFFGIIIKIKNVRLIVNLLWTISNLLQIAATKNKPVNRNVLILFLSFQFK